MHNYNECCERYCAIKKSTRSPTELSAVNFAGHAGARVPSFGPRSYRVCLHRNVLRKGANLPLLVGFRSILSGHLGFKGVGSTN